MPFNDCVRIERAHRADELHLYGKVPDPTDLSSVRLTRSAESHEQAPHHGFARTQNPSLVVPVNGWEKHAGVHPQIDIAQFSATLITKIV